MVNPSNSYADKIYSEHPIALWALDEELQKSFTGSSSTTNIATLFTYDYTITGFPMLTIGTSETDTVSLLNQSDVMLFVSSMYPQLNGPYMITGINNSPGQYAQIHVVPQFNLEYTSEPSTPVPGDAGPIQFFRNTSQPIQLSNHGIANVGEFFSVSANPYVYDSTKTGHYLYVDPNATNSQSMLVNRLVENTGIPIVYGASNVSELYPNQNGQYPSLVLPGLGFLNKEGQLKEMTFEFWLSVKSNYSYDQKDPNGYRLSVPFRFFGPVASDDGLYIDGYSMILKIGNFFTSYQVGDWQRPMLIQIQTGHDGAALVINGEVVGQMTYDAYTDQDFPAKMSLDNKEQDWIGFFVNEWININIDCVAIYPELVSTTITKKRFAYGQAIELPQYVFSKHGGQSLNIDYSVANYLSNYNYPVSGSWQNGIIHNLVVQGSQLSTPQYNLPDFYCKKGNSNVPLSRLIQDTKTEENTQVSGIQNSISFRPKTEYKSFAKFEKTPLGSNVFSVIYAKISMWNHSMFSNERQLIFRVYDRISENSLLLTSQKNGNNFDLNLSFIIDGQEQDPIFSETLDWATRTFGFDIAGYEQQNGTTFLSGDQSNLIIYLGGDDISDMASFQGEVYELGFIDEKNLLLNPELNYDQRGIYQATHWTDSRVFKLEYDVDIRSTYKLMFKNIGNYRYPDIGISGHWIDSIPLSRLAKQVGDEYKFDFLQINNGLTQLSLNTDANIIEPIGPLKMVFSYSNASTTTSEADLGWGWDTAPFLSNTKIYKTNGSTSGFKIANGSIFAVDPDFPVSFDSGNASLFILFDVPGISTYNTKVKTLQIASQINDAVIGSRTGVELKAYGTDDNYYSIYKGSTPHNYLTNDSGIELLGDFSQSFDRGLRLSIPEQKLTALQFSYMSKKIPSSNTILLTLKNQRAGYENVNIFIAPYSDDEMFLYATNKDQSNLHTFITEDLDWYIDGHKITPVDIVGVSGKKVLSIEVGEWSTIGIGFPKPLDFSGVSSQSIDIVGPGVINNLVSFRLLPNEEYKKISSQSWQATKDSGTWSTASAGTWESVFYIQQDAIKSIDLEYLFDLYFGINKIVTESDTDELGLSNMSYTIYKNASWSSKVIKPA